jgi:hypothetical protein
LRKGSESSGTARAGDARRLLHGQRARVPDNAPDREQTRWRAITDLAAEVERLEGVLGAEFREEDGTICAWARPAVDAVAVQAHTLKRAVEQAENLRLRDSAKPNWDGVSKIAERYHHALREEALTLSGRLAARESAARVDVATHWAVEHFKERAEAAERELRELREGER